MGPGTLQDVLAGLPDFQHPNLLVSGAKQDDAGVYQLSDDLALVQTVDFFTPMVDDPYVFGQVAAANALSDIYAMGGQPLTAMNITAFPTCSLDIEILRDILAGGAAKIKESGALLVGGHTIEDEEPKYGLAVTGTVNPENLLRNDGARNGDLLFLTKPLGTGIITTAVKGELASENALQAAIKNMVALNKAAAEVVRELDVHACTDVTGFGLLGHAYEMASGSGVALEIEVAKVPLLEQVCELAGMGLVPAGARRNRDYLNRQVLWKTSLEPEMQDILCDPQTSGGLLLSLPAEQEQEALKAFQKSGLKVAIIGRVVAGEPGMITVK